MSLRPQLPSPPSTGDGGCESWRGVQEPGWQRAVQLACTGQAERHKLGAQCWPGCQGCRRPEQPPPRPHQVHTGLRPLSQGLAGLLSPATSSLEGLPREGPGASAERLRGPTWPSAGSRGFLVKPKAAPHGNGPPHPPSPPRQAPPEPWPTAAPGGASFGTWGLHEVPTRLCALGAAGSLRSACPGPVLPSHHLTGARSAACASSGHGGPPT